MDKEEVRVELSVKALVARLGGRKVSVNLK
jgi:hypothetical protein